MNDKVWFITDAGCGMGVDITKAALAAGHKVMATGRNTDSVAKALPSPMILSHSLCAWHGWTHRFTEGNGIG